MTLLRKYQNDKKPIKSKKNLDICLSKRFTKYIAQKPCDEKIPEVTTTPIITVWRVNQCKLDVLDFKHHGYFFDGDSYLILSTTKTDAGIETHHIYVWVGKHSTADEYGFAAWKMVRLAGNLPGVVIQHHEYQNCESQSLLKLFKAMVIVKGDNNTCFSQFILTADITRLFCLSCKKVL
uniref:Severin (Trinotate prediction) n=1 Tax=Henneguya salminicola TaxID=69463 RepID=A0A6G3MH52_HENSL